jgi:hypothetical protein
MCPCSTAQPPEKTVQLPSPGLCLVPRPTRNVRHQSHPAPRLAQMVQVVQLAEMMQVVLMGARLHLCDTEATNQACVQLLN